MDRNLINQLIFLKAEEFLKENPERLTEEEKIKFRKGLMEWFGRKSETITDEVWDFLAGTGIIANYKKREDVFASYLNKKYADLKFKKIMDVGAGRMCRLSRSLAKIGCEMYAIDPNIRISQREAQRFGIKSIDLGLFACDDFSIDGKGTDIQSVDHIVGLEPCDATEHIIRQGLKYDKPFDIVLCAAPHDALNGKKFLNYQQWHKHLKSISSEVHIKKIGESFYASNTEQERQP